MSPQGKFASTASSDFPDERSGRLLAALSCLWLITMFVAGGSSLPTPWVVALHSLASLPVIVLSLWTLQKGFPTGLATAGALLLLACFVLLALHLLPLPPDIWTSLPNRDFQKKIFMDLGEPLPWQPLTLTPGNTKAALLALLPAAAGYLAALSVSTQHRIWLAVTVFAAALIGLLFGVMQKLQGSGSFFFLYDYGSSASTTGMFGNRNFFAAQLYATIPVVAALAMWLQAKRRIGIWTIVVFALIYVAVLVTALGATASRSGVILSMTAIVMTAAFVFRPPKQAMPTGAFKGVLFAAIAGVLLISQVGLAAILRFSNSDLVDVRGEIASVTWQAMRQFFPFGSGFGSFVPVYQMFETPETLRTSYINHAHNDWLELVMEGGLPALLLIAAFVLLFLSCGFQLLRREFASPDRALLRAFWLSAFLLQLHGFVDYALRTPALLGFFALACGFATLGNTPAAHGKPTQAYQRPPTIRKRVVPRAPFGRP